MNRMVGAAIVDRDALVDDDDGAASVARRGSGAAWFSAAGSGVSDRGGEGASVPGRVGPAGCGAAVDVGLGVGVGDSLGVGVGVGETDGDGTGEGVALAAAEGVGLGSTADAADGDADGASSGSTTSALAGTATRTSVVASASALTTRPAAVREGSVRVRMTSLRRGTGRALRGTPPSSMEIVRLARARWKRVWCIPLCASPPCRAFGRPYGRAVSADRISG